MGMFCYQCQETAGGKGCTVKGVCGKTGDVSNLQDLLLYVLKGISIYRLKSGEAGIKSEEADKFAVEGLFSTVTNVNFDKDFFVRKIKEGLTLRDELRDRLQKAGIEPGKDLHDAALWYGDSLEEFEQKAAQIGVQSTEDEDVRSLRQLIMYGLKGMAAYAHHAAILGFSSGKIYDFMHKALASTLDDGLSTGELTALVMETGSTG